MEPIYCLLFSFVVFVSYVTYIYFLHGQQRSISDSWYRLTLGEKWLFCLSTWGYVLPLFLMVLTNNGGEWTRIIFFLATTLLVIVPIFPDFKMIGDKAWHTIGAEGGIALGMLWGILSGFWFMVIPFFIFTVLMARNNIRNHTYWIEIVAYFTILCMCWMKYVYLPSLITI